MGPRSLVVALSDGESPELQPCHQQDAAHAWCFLDNLARDLHCVGDMGAGHPSAVGFRRLLWGSGLGRSRSAPAAWGQLLAHEIPVTAASGTVPCGHVAQTLLVKGPQQIPQ